MYIYFDITCLFFASANLLKWPIVLYYMEGPLFKDLSHESYYFGQDA